MKRKFAALTFLIIGAVPPAWADLTVRYTFSFKSSSLLPPQAEIMKRQTAESATLQAKDDRIYASLGRMFTITDHAKGVLTLVDPDSRRFSSVPVAEFVSKIMAAQKTQPMPPDAQRVFDRMKVEVKASKTGQTATIHEIQTEENLLVITVEVAAGMEMRTEVHTWTATAEALQRNPELREMAAYASRPKGGLDPVEMMTKSLAGMPGFGDKLRGPMQEMLKSSGGVVVRMCTAAYMSTPGGGTSAGEALAEVTMELSELSSAPVPDWRFQVPEGYQAAPAEALLETLFPAVGAGDRVGGGILR